MTPAERFEKLARELQIFLAMSKMDEIARQR
jgi:hypothetical protein